MNPIITGLGEVLGSVAGLGILVGILMRFGNQKVRMSAREFPRIPVRLEWFLQVARCLIAAASACALAFCIAPRVPVGMRDGVYGAAVGLIFGGLLAGMVIDAFATGMLSATWFERLIRGSPPRTSTANPPSDLTEDPSA